MTGSHQNAAAGHHAMTPRSAIPAKSARAQTVNNVAGGKFCHAELRVCGADSPKRGSVQAASRRRLRVIDCLSPASSSPCSGPLSVQ